MKPHLVSRETSRRQHGALSGVSKQHARATAVETVISCLLAATSLADVMEFEKEPYVITERRERLILWAEYMHHRVSASSVC